MAKADKTEGGLNLAEALANPELATPLPTEGAALTTEQQLDLLRRLASLEKQLKEQKEETERILAESNASSGKRYSPKEKAFAGVEGYKFRVTPIAKKDGDSIDHLQPAEVEAVDESEALRWYCVANESRPGSGQALDPMRVRLKVESIGRKRADSVMRQKQIGALRLKVQSGVTLSPKELALLDTCEKEVFQF